ncbi:MAG TPA: hypothetical protein VJC09_02510 [Candidatus Saccharimonadales bacterium]|nr:hypothetical protein [Candidatus Saccharimonadales bacterium]
MANFVYSIMPELGPEFLRPAANSGSNLGVVEALHGAADYAYHAVAEKRGINPELIPSLGGACFDTVEAMAESPELKGVKAWTERFHTLWFDHGLLVYMNGNVKELADPTWKQFAPSASNSAPDILMGTPEEMIDQGRANGLGKEILQIYARAGGLGKNVLQVYPATGIAGNVQHSYAKVT